MSQEKPKQGVVFVMISLTYRWMDGERVVIGQL